VLTDLKDPKAPPQMQELQAAGRDLKVDVIDAGVRQPDEIDNALQSLANQRVDLVIVLQTSMLLGERRQIAAQALAKRLPTIFGYREHILAGGLLSYGVDLRWCFQRGAYFVDKILPVSDASQSRRRGHRIDVLLLRRTLVANGTARPIQRQPVPSLWG